MSMSVDTPVEEVLSSPGSRPRMIQLARMVVGPSDVSATAAISQFPQVAAVGRLITMKREGHFDYAALVQKVEGSWVYPPHEKVSLLMDAVEAGELESFDFESLGLPGEIDLEAAFPNAAMAGTAPAAGVEVDRAPAKVVDMPPIATPAPKKTRGRSKATTPPQEESEVQASAPSEGLEELLGLIKFQGKEIDHLREELQEHNASLDHARAGILAVVQYLSTINNNVSGLVLMLDPHGQPESMPESVVSMLRDIAPADFSARVAEAQKAEANKAPKSAPRQQAAPQPAQVQQASAQEENPYTPDDLARMGKEELEALAQRLGIAPAPVLSILRRRVKEALGY